MTVAGWRESASHDDRDAAIAMTRQAVDELHQPGRLFCGVLGTGVLVETFMDRRRGRPGRSSRGDDRLANLLTDDDSAMLEITLLRPRALLARPGATTSPTETW